MVRSAVFSSLLLGLSLAGPIAAQEVEQVWMPERPDAHAPAGVTRAITYQAGQLAFSYRYEYARFEGTRIGPDSVSAQDIFDLEAFAFSTVPTEGLDQIHWITAALGLSDRVTLMGELPIIVTQVENLDRTPLLFDTQGEGVGDIRASLLVNVFNEGPYRAHLTGGVSFPTGSQTERATTPTGSEILPYRLRTGSGTYDLHPGATFIVMNDEASFGLQVNGNIRIGTNDRDYQLGNRWEGSMWASFALNDYFSTSLRVRAETWDNIEGLDSRLALTSSPLADPFFQGGQRIDVPLGFNLHIREGLLAGHRLSIEAAIPVHEDLDGAQLSNDWGFSLVWEKAFF